MSNQEKLNRMKAVLKTKKAVLNYENGKSVEEIMYLDNIGFIVMVLDDEFPDNWIECVISDEIALRQYDKVVV